MKKNGLSLAFIIPLVILSLAVAGIFTYKLFSEGDRAKATDTTTPAVVKTLPKLNVSGTKPSTGYGKLAVTPTPIPTLSATSQTPASLDDALNATDEGKSDFNAFDQMMTGL